MLLLRQKIMLAIVFAVSLIIGIATCAYIIAADRVGREYLLPEISQTFTNIIQDELARSTDEVTLRSILGHMVLHYQIHEIALYNQNNQRLFHSYDHSHRPKLPITLDNVITTQSLHNYPITKQDENGQLQTLTLTMVSNIALPEFFFIDTLTTTLFAVSLSSLVIFLLYYFIRRWQKKPYYELLSAINKNSEAPLNLQTHDPDIQPLANALNDLFYIRDQRTQNLKSAHSQAESARIRATRLSNETQIVNANLAREISVRKGMEVQLKNTKILLDDILNAMPSAIFAIDVHQRIVQCNQQAGFWLDTEANQLIGRNLLAILPELEPHKKIINSDKKHPEKIERISLTSFNKEIIADVLSSPMLNDQQAQRVIRIDDITQRQRMEMLMIQTEKMMSVGGLAAGMAHEINNPLSAILQNLQNIRRRLSYTLPANRKSADKFKINLKKLEEYLDDRKIYTFLNQIQDAGERANHIINSMLKFSRNDQSQKRMTNITELVATTLTIIKTDKHLKNINISTHIADNIPDVHCVPSEIEQVLLNLIKNAQQALANNMINTHKNTTDNGKIYINIETQKNQLKINIEDNGPGIAEDVIPHIFEPFYTTKEVGQGTGLGLSISYFIILLLRTIIRVNSVINA